MWDKLFYKMKQTWQESSSIHEQGIKIHTERHLTCQLYIRSAVAFIFVKCCMVTRHIHCGKIVLKF